MELFTGVVMVDGFNGRVMIATVAVDLGVDHRESAFVLILEWPDSLLTYKQRGGRGLRDGKESTTALVAGVSSLITLIKCIYSQQDRLLNKLDKDTNNTIVGRATNNRWNNTSTKSTNAYSTNSLTRSQRKRLRQNQLDNFHDVLLLFNLDMGCQHQRLDLWSANGKLCNNMIDQNKECGVCPMCNGKWSDSYMTLCMDGVTSFLRSLLWGTIITKATKNNIMSLV